MMSASPSGSPSCLLQVRGIIMQAFGSTAVRSSLPVFAQVAQELVEVLLLGAGQQTGVSHSHPVLQVRLQVCTATASKEWN
jgi:hypothetical protein